MTTTRQTGSNYKTKHTQELKRVENISGAVHYLPNIFRTLVSKHRHNETIV